MHKSLEVNEYLVKAKVQRGRKRGGGGCGAGREEEFGGKRREG